MKKILLFIIVIPNFILAQVNFDIRNVNWGMSIKEVKNSEKYLTPSSGQNNELVYSKIELNEEVTCKLIYYFSNGRLRQLTYVVYGPKDNNSRVTPEHSVPISYKINKVKFIFEALIKKQMTPFVLGWRITGTSGDTDKKLKEGKIDDETINLIQTELNRVNGDGVKISYKNERSWASFEIRHFKKEEFNTWLKLDDDYYNTYLWLKISPSIEVEKELKKSEF
ncbi:hypothetical protein ASF10_09950 [Flavobacterium sp. Leaf82]|uniref:hypothetical protein n=1 Tax=Flavobacterium sp. Leaf82 TaxID=1736238 RepID=UPI0006FF1212|nr:hypothetical protein [Flavobacterium sp. Leaf82]KQO22681.1 hypothetical protein ASF10_09950 [Flavobacterium sp. Leaf82]